jgi:hypothetical protein
MERTFIDLFIDRSDPKKVKRHIVSILVWVALVGDVALTVWVALKTTPIYDVADLAITLLMLFVLQATLVTACWGIWELKKHMTKLIIEKLKL